MANSINPPYGGLLIQSIENNQTLPKNAIILSVNEIIESEFLNLATGVFSPLSGFMNSAQVQSVYADSRLPGTNLAWTIPIVFDISEEQKLIIKKSLSNRVYIQSESSKALLGWIEVEEVFEHDKESRIQSTFGVTSPEHPGVKLVSDMGPYLLAGKVVAFQNALDRDPLAYPAGVRQQLMDKGISRLAGFQTRNVVHRAHEYLQRVALEITGGLLVHPVVGWKKSGDFRAEVVRTGYENFIQNYFPTDKVILAFLRLAMRYAGPKEAVLHAIVRKNYGCSHFIVGRDHAGVGGFYGSYDAHNIFSTLPDLGIEILRLREPFYCSRCEGIATDRSCGHGEKEREYISGTMIRNILSGGEYPPAHIFRPEVLNSIQRFKDKEGFFYE